MYQCKQFIRAVVLVIHAILLSSVVVAQDLAEQVVIRRTEYGVPHIKAENIKAASFAMGYVQVEDYGESVLEGLVKARGEWALRVLLDDSLRAAQLDRDAAAKLRYARAEETYDLLDQDTQDLLEGYVAGVNRYIDTHPDEFADRVWPTFTAMDAHAKSIGAHSGSKVRSFIQSLDKEAIAQIKETTWMRLAAHSEDVHPDV